jgi:hypothetical protein
MRPRSDTRLPRSITRLLALTERRLGRARVADGRCSRLAATVAASHAPRTLARATRLTSSRAGIGPSGLDVLAAPRDLSPAAAEPAPGAEPQPKWWTRLGPEFGVSDWALEQLFGDQSSAGTDPAQTPSRSAVAPAAEVGGPVAPSAPAWARAVARASRPGAPPVPPRTARIIEGPAPRGSSPSVARAAAAAQLPGGVAGQEPAVESDEPAVPRQEESHVPSSPAVSQPRTSAAPRPPVSAAPPAAPSSRISSVQPPPVSAAPRPPVSAAPPASPPSRITSVQPPPVSAAPAPPQSRISPAPTVAASPQAFSSLSRKRRPAADETIASTAPVAPEPAPSGEGAPANQAELAVERGSPDPPAESQQAAWQSHPGRAIARIEEAGRRRTPDVPTPGAGPENPALPDSPPLPSGTPPPPTPATPAPRVPATPARRGANVLLAPPATSAPSPVPVRPQARPGGAPLPPMPRWRVGSRPAEPVKEPAVLEHSPAVLEHSPSRRTERPSSAVSSSPVQREVAAPPPAVTDQPRTRLAPGPQTTVGESDFIVPSAPAEARPGLELERAAGRPRIEPAPGPVWPSPEPHAALTAPRQRVRPVPAAHRLQPPGASAARALPPVARSTSTAAAAPRLGPAPRSERRPGRLRRALDIALGRRAPRTDGPPRPFSPPAAAPGSAALAVEAAPAPFERSAAEPRPRPRPVVALGVAGAPERSRRSQATAAPAVPYEPGSWSGTTAATVWQDRRDSPVVTEPTTRQERPRPPAVRRTARTRSTTDHPGIPAPVAIAADAPPPPPPPPTVQVPPKPSFQVPTPESSLALTAPAPSLPRVPRHSISSAAIPSGLQPAPIHPTQPVPMAARPAMLARQAAGTDGSPGGAPALAGGGSAGQAPSTGSGGDSDAIYDEVIRRLRQEQEQLGQVIPHPF